MTNARIKEENQQRVLEKATGDFGWIDTEDNDRASGKPALWELLKMELVYYPDSFGVEMQQPTVQIANKDVVMFTIFGKKKDIPEIANGLTVCGTGLLRKTNDSKRSGKAICEMKETYLY